MLPRVIQCGEPESEVRCPQTPVGLPETNGNRVREIGGVLEAA